MATKLYKCNECDRMVPIRSKGLCGICHAQSHPKEKKSYTFKTSEKVKLRKKSISNFFEAVKHKLIPISVESGKVIKNFGKQNMCHILPKRFYRSVETDIENIIVLTLEEHTRFDYLLDIFDLETLYLEFPRTMQLVKERINIMQDRVTEKHGKLFNILLAE